MRPYFERDGIAIYHGDCLEHPDLWTGAAVLVSDPPYGMGLRSGMGGKFGDMTIENDGTTDARNAALQAWGARPALVFGRWSVPRPDGTRMVLTWEKGEHVGMGDLALPWKPNTEEIYVLGTGFSGHRGGSVLRVLAVAGCVGSQTVKDRHHPTEKPVPLMRALVAKCPPGVVADPFMGSGSTLVACAELGRSAIGFELDEAYCETAARRVADALDQGSLFGFEDVAA